MSEVKTFTTPDGRVRFHSPLYVKLDEIQARVNRAYNTCLGIEKTEDRSQVLGDLNSAHIALFQLMSECYGGRSVKKEVENSV